MNAKKLTGKVAVVTGASKGIGAAIAKHLAAEGAAVVVNYASSKEGADKVVAEITRQGGKAVAVQADMSRRRRTSNALFAETKKAFGRLDILVNNAGIYEFAPLESVTEEHFHKQFNLNVLGLILATQEAVEAFGPRAERHQHQFGRRARSRSECHRSTAAPRPRSMPMTRSLAKELGPRKIRVNAINPGMVETEGTHSAGIDRQRLARSRSNADAARPHRSARRTSPAVAVFLASDRLRVDHGRDLHHFRRQSVTLTQSYAWLNYTRHDSHGDAQFLLFNLK